MKIKLWLKYLVYAIVIALLIIFREHLSYLYTAYLHKSFEFHNPYAVLSTLLGVCIGVALGVEHFINELGKEGRWKVKLPKLILVGLPALYFSLTNILIYSGNQFLKIVIDYPHFYLTRYCSEGYVSLFQLLLGYIIITSFYKYKGEII